MTESNLKLKQSAGYFAGFLAMGLSATVYSATLPSLADSLGTQVTDMSWLFSWSAAVYFIGGLLGGFLIDRFKINRVLFIGSLFIAGALIMVPHWGSIAGVALSLAGISLGSGTLDTGGNAGIVWIHREKSTPFMNALHMLYGVGAFLAPFIISWLILKPNGLENSYHIIALMTLPFYLPLLFIKSPTSPIEAESENGGAKGHVGLIVMAAALLFLYVGLEVGYTSWITSYTVITGLGNESLGALMASLYWGAIAVGRLLTIPIATRVKPMGILIACFVGVLAFTIGFWIFNDSVLALWIGTIGGGIMAGAVYPTMMSYVGSVIPLSGKIASYIMSSGSLGAMVIPFLIGVLFEKINPTALQLVVSISAALALMVYFVLLASVNRKES